MPSQLPQVLPARLRSPHDSCFSLPRRPAPGAPPGHPRHPHGGPDGGTAAAEPPAALGAARSGAGGGGGGSACCCARGRRQVAGAHAAGCGARRRVSAAAVSAGRVTACLCTRAARHVGGAAGLRRPAAARLYPPRCWLALTAPLSRASPAPPRSLAALQASCLSALASTRMPTSRNEEYRFTDVAPVLALSLAAADGAGVDAAAAAAARPLKKAAAATVVVVDGVMDEQRSSLGALPAGVYVGGVAGAPADVVSFALVSWAGCWGWRA